jgi:hypothetical protein
MVVVSFALLLVGCDVAEQAVDRLARWIIASRATKAAHSFCAGDEVCIEEADRALPQCLDEGYSRYKRALVEISQSQASEYQSSMARIVMLDASQCAMMRTTKGHR